MSCRMEVLRCVLVLRTVATAYVATVKAHAKVDPCVAYLQAIFAPLCTWLDVADGVEVCTLL